MRFFAVIALHARTSPTPCLAAAPPVPPPSRRSSPLAAACRPRARRSPVRGTAAPGALREAPPSARRWSPPLPLRGGGPLRPRRRDPLHPRAAVAVALAAEATTLAAAEAGRHPAPSRNAAADPDAVASFFAATVVVASGVRATRGDAKGDKPMAGPPLKRSNVPMSKCPQV